MERIAIFGKGGIGKSTLAANLAAVYARQGLRVLLVGCDPKHDTTVSLTEGRPIRTVVEQSMFMDASGADVARVLVRGRLGVDCVEAGGPEPGIGCAGRGISRMIELLEGGGLLRQGRHDVAIFDVLGDVVCGGFAAPLRQGFADKVVIVSSEELMSLYAVNNIARAVRNYAANGIALCGLVANLRDPAADRKALERFALLLGSRVLAFLPRDAAVREAEYRRVTAVEHAPKAEVSRRITALAGELLSFDRAKAAVPTPLPDEDFHELSRRGFSGKPVHAGEAPREAGQETGQGRGEGRSGPAQGQEGPRQGQGREEGQGSGPGGQGGTGGRGGPGPDMEKTLAKRANLWEGDPGPNSQVWGSPDQWRSFFCDFETRRHARTRLEVRAPVVHIWHQDLECSYATPDYYDMSLLSFFKFPWPRPPQPFEDWERGGGREGGREGGWDPEKGGKGGKKGKGPDKRPDQGEVVREAMTNLRDLDVIHGGGRKLSETIGKAVEHAEGRAEAIVVHSTCVPTVIGDDAEAVVGRWKGRSKVPIIYTNPAQNNKEVDVGLVLLEKLKAGRPGQRGRRGRCVNLVGFPEGPALLELTRALAASGVEVNARVMPSLSPEAAERFLDAGVQVLYPNGAYAAAYREVFETLPIKSLKLDAPYGFEGTRAWVAAVAGEFGCGPHARAACGKHAAGLARERDAARREAEGRGLAFVVDGWHVNRLMDPAQMWGVPVLRMLRELGFAVSVLCYGKARKPAPGLAFFGTPAELDALLRKGKFEAVYSEYAADPRLSAAGKAQFSLEPFEMGFEGALRTARRLAAVCRWPFPRRYGRYTGGGA